MRNIMKLFCAFALAAMLLPSLTGCITEPADAVVDYNAADQINEVVDLDADGSGAEDAPITEIPAIRIQKYMDDQVVTAPEETSDEPEAVADDPATEASAPQAAPAPTSAPHIQANHSLTIKGEEINYVSAYGAASAPSGSNAGIWSGSDSTTDGRVAYFIGHNPGIFHNVMNLDAGDTVTVKDANGNARTYTVTFVTNVRSYWYWVEEDVCYYDANTGIDHTIGIGPNTEAVILQTCIGNGDYRVVLAV